MAELVPLPFRDLVTRLLREPSLQDSVFELRRRRWYRPDPAGPDLSVRLHGRLAGNPLGPAAGPHTQMAQNILLSYVAGARILELKTVQVDDRLHIPRPCIDMTNVGYNVEWSQELRVEESLREYVAGAMLIEIFRRVSPEVAGVHPGDSGTVLHDISVGYDLKGIRSDKVRGFLQGMREASRWVERLRAEIPAELAAARDLDFSTRLSDSITLSTFHGCPADEIERICEFLIGECDFDVIIKMNPPMLGRERLEHLLHDVLGYHELQVNPQAYTNGLQFVEALQINDRLTRFATGRGRRVGFKFSNTLEVVNHRDFFTPDNRIMYLSGQPLHVITLALTDQFRQAVGPDVAISFSAGIDQLNAAVAVACGFVPVTMSTDLLRPGGYGRLPTYFERLVQDMGRVSAAAVDAYILRCFGQEDEARRLAAAEGRPTEARAVQWAGLLNTTVAAEQAAQDPRYHADRNRKIPKRMDSQLTTFDCITCDKCLPVCPNAANFTYPTPRVTFDYQDLVVPPQGAVTLGSATKRFAITEAMQIACYADSCNECGNCDTFCPEYGGPYIKKPTFFGTLKSWTEAAPRDGFVVGRESHVVWIRGRIRGREYYLRSDPPTGRQRLSDGVVEVDFEADGTLGLDVCRLQPLSTDHVVDVGVYHTLRHLLHGVLDASRVNWVNAGLRF